MGKKVLLVEKTVYKYGKHDLERLGLFIEMPYMNKLKKDKKKKTKAAIGEVLGGMLPGGNKTRCGNMDGYFGDEFVRIFNGERSKKRKKKVDDSDKLPFIPAGATKMHGCPGDYIGSFSGTISAFSPKKRKTPKYKPEKPNPVTGPGKKGGPGYIDITLGKYPIHKAERFRKDKKDLLLKGKPPMVPLHFPQPYFYKNPYLDPKENPPIDRIYVWKDDEPLLDDKLWGRPIFVPVGPAKWLGGCKMGCFSKWPAWQADRWLTPKEIEDFVPEVIGEEPPILDFPDFIPQVMGVKSQFTKSILCDTDFKVNTDNWKVYEPVYIKYLGMEHVLL